MFCLNSPEILEVISNSVISTNDRVSKLKSKNVVVVSVIGSSASHEGKGYKRAFRLILDSFGTPSLFKGNSSNHSNKASSRVRVRKKKDEAKGEKSGGREASESNKAEEESGDNNGEKIELEDEKEIGAIDGFYTEDEHILFLHLQGAFDPKSFLLEWKALSQKLESKDAGFSEIWAEIKSKYCRSLLLLFSLSHLMLVSSPASYFDTSYIQLFRIIDTVRHEALPFTSKLLGKIDGIPKAWRDHARMCSPRILFLFQTRSERPKRLYEELPVEDPMKEMQYKLEDEIYHIFRKCRIVTNISANSLFAIPTTQEYVFIYDEGVQEPEMCDDAQSRLTHLTKSFCERMSEALSDPTLSDYKNSSKLSFAATFPTVYSTNASKRICDQLRTYREVLSDFREFITSHSRLALDSGFDDDSKHVAEHKHFFVLPTFQLWRKAYQALSNYFVQGNHSDNRARDALALMNQFTNADTEYLESQCAKMFPKVYALYLKNLPEIFPENIHKAKVAHAIDAFMKVSRGPGVRSWITKLIEKCDRYWKRGHQQCEARSLLEHTCSHPLHRFKVEDHLEVIPLPVMEDSLPEMEHSTGLRIISYCNCGHRQGSRDEPFTIREANYSFYERLAQDCCDRQIETDRYNSVKIDFPVFTPPPGHDKSTIHPQEMLLIYQQKLLGLIQHNHFEVASQDLEDELRQEESLEFEEEEEEQAAALLVTQGKAEEGPVAVLEENKIAKEDSPELPRIPNVWSKPPHLIEQDLLPRSELENEYIYKRIRERKAAEGNSGGELQSKLEAEKSEYQARLLELTNNLKDDMRKSDELRKEWFKLSGYDQQRKLLIPNGSDSRDLKDNFFKNFKLPMKAMALSMRMKPNWEQASKRLPENVVNWVNDYTSRRRFLVQGEDDSSPLLDLEDISDLDDSFPKIEALDLEDEDDSMEDVEKRSLQQILPSEEAFPLDPAVNEICEENLRVVPCSDEESVSSLSEPEEEPDIAQQSSREDSRPDDVDFGVAAKAHLETAPTQANAVCSGQSDVEGAESKVIVTKPENITNDGIETETENTPRAPSRTEISSSAEERAAEEQACPAQDDKSTSGCVAEAEENMIPGQEDTSMQYLPGMLHSRSLKGLLPLFSSWSLVCVGSSSLYTHTSGITHQPGFLNGSNTLLPWDKMVKAEAGVSKPIPRLIRGRKPTGRAKRITDEFTVKVFVGVEYECKRGHRFLLEGPDKILHTSGQHGTPYLKEAALVVVTSDMPLYYKCPCKDSRDGATMIAQLMRVHIVTPKAPVYVTLDPKVQPGPNPSPVFFPGNKEPIKLTPSSYWILRLPYCYVGDDQVYVPSKDVTRYNGRLLKGFVSVDSMTPEETKIWEIQNTSLN